MKIHHYFFLLFSSLNSFLYSSFEEKLAEANKNYQSGMSSTIYVEQQQAFNQSLKIYEELVNGISYPSSQLYEALANTYFQLNELSWAILYYEKALKLQPRNLKIRNDLDLVKKQLALEVDMPYTLIQKTLFDSIFSIEERFSFLTLLSLITVILISFLIWWPHKLLKICCCLSSTFSLLLLFNIVLSWYLNPIQGILIESTGYYREPDKLQSQLTLLPKKAGTKVNVLAATSQGSWLKTRDSEDVTGYVPASSIRII